VFVQRTIPALSYEDCAAAIDWLTKAFGFREVDERYMDDEGRVTHAELEYEGGRVMLGWPGPHYRAPNRLAEECEAARRMYDNPYVLDGVHVQVDDLDAHHARARAAGADILRGPDDEPFGRLYTAADPEGHRWMFLQPA
jgi:PhnB protein